MHYINQLFTYFLTIVATSTQRNDLAATTFMPTMQIVNDRSSVSSMYMGI